MANKTYYLNLTPANIRNGSICLSECMGAFPADTLGGANKSEAAPRSVDIHCDSEIVHTDLDREKRIFRSRGWVRRFFRDNRILAAHRLVLEQLDPYCYRISKEPCIRIKCLSFQQPWVDLILRGEKLVENRSRNWTQAAQKIDAGQGVSLGVHVSSGRSVWDNLRPEEQERLAPGWHESDDPNAGHVVGVVDILQICTPQHLPKELREHKFTDRRFNWCWRLGNPCKLSVPFPIRTYGGLFNADIPCRLLPVGYQATPW